MITLHEGKTKISKTKTGTVVFEFNLDHHIGTQMVMAMLLTKKTKRVLSTLLHVLDAQGYTDDGDYMFQTQRGGNRPLNGNGFWRTLWDAKKVLGWTWKLGTHSMRKTFAARIYQNLLDSKNCDALRILQAGLGHENINNTIKYLSFKEDELIEAIQAVFGGEE